MGSPDQPRRLKDVHAQAVRLHCVASGRCILIQGGKYCLMMCCTEFTHNYVTLIAVNIRPCDAVGRTHVMNPCDAVRRNPDHTSLSSWTRLYASEWSCGIECRNDPSLLRRPNPIPSYLISILDMSSNLFPRLKKGLKHPSMYHTVTSAQGAYQQWQV